jgi:CRISPR-associated protein Csm3
MHKKSLNQLRMKLEITASGPILIAAGKPPEGSGDPTIEFVTTRKDGGETVYIPGSSLKGVIRSYCEKVARTLGILCCNPLLNSDEDDDKPDCSCGRKVDIKKKRAEIPVPEIYKKHSCHLCKLFGSTGIASRIFIEDAYPKSNLKPYGKRTNTAINRATGAVQEHQLFSMRVMAEGTRFHSEIHVRNFELWQLGLLGLAIRDLHRERIRIGFAKSRGLGKVKGTIKKLTIAYPFYKLTDDGKKMRRLTDGVERVLLEDGKFHVYGVGSLMGDDGDEYGYSASDRAVIEVCKAPEAKDDWISSEIVLTDYEKQVERLLKVCVEDYWIPEALRNSREQTAQEN